MEQRINVWVWAVALSMSPMLGCASDLADEHTHEGAVAGGGAQQAVQSTPGADGVTETTIDATSDARWTYFSFATGAEVTPEAPESSSAWDLGFQRFKIKSNGGVSGTGGTTVAVLADTEFDAVQSAPESGYEADAPDSEADKDDQPDLAFDRNENWYAYNPTDHTLSPKPDVFVVATGAGKHYKVELLNYYDDAGTAGVLSFRWAELP